MNKLASFFSRVGILRIVLSDNMHRHLEMKERQRVRWIEFVGKK